MSYYPTTWYEFVGQGSAVRQLRIKAKSARMRIVPMPHTLIHCQIAGVGKTALAELTARELGGAIFRQTEPLKPRQVPFVFRELKDGDILFLDEVHKQFQGGKANIEWLLSYLDRRVIPTATGEQQGPAVTVIAATTDVGKLGDMFMSRFEIQLPLEPYTDEEAAQIAAKLAVKVLEDDGDGLPLPTTQVCAQIARAASNIPRDMSRILASLRDLVWAGELNQGLADGDYDLTEALAMTGFTPDGLDARERRYLMLLEASRGEPLGAQALRDALGEVPEGIRYIETRLVGKGLIIRTKGGRQLTGAGMARTRELAAAA